jgi:hypothetical protein
MLGAGSLLLLKAFPQTPFVKTVSTLLLVFAGLGFGLSLLVHLTSIAGLRPAIGDSVFVLHAGIFVVGLPTVLAITRISRELGRRGAWEVLLTGCPLWLKLGVLMTVGYAIVNFMAFAATQGRSPRAVTESATPAVVRAFSGHWLAFYSAAFAALYSLRGYRNVRESEERDQV